MGKIGTQQEKIISRRTRTPARSWRAPARSPLPPLPLPASSPGAVSGNASRTPASGTRGARSRRVRALPVHLVMTVVLSPAAG